MKSFGQKGSIEYYLLEYCDGDYGRLNMEMDQESNGSSTEEVESPRSVAAVEKLRRRRYRAARARNQVSKIKTEDSHLGEDNFFVVAQCMIYSRPVLPASPLRP